MKYVQYTVKARTRGSKGRKDIRLAYLDGDCVVDVHDRNHDLPSTMKDFIKNDYYWKRAADCKKLRRPFCTTKLNNVILDAPINGMDKVLCVKLNYKDFCEKHEQEIPSIPTVYSKFSSTINAPGDPVTIRTDVAENVDYQVELCVVIGQITTEVKAENAMKHVFGYTIAQNICARDWQNGPSGQLLLGSAMDTFCPIGPCIVTLDEIADVNNLYIKCSLNNQCVQDSNTNQFIFSIPEIIERISSVMTLYPGDLILTGTPAGVGMYSTPPQYLQPGDVLTSEIQDIGVLETRFEEYIPPERIPRHKEILWPY